MPSQYTSQRCSCCGHVAKASRLSQAKFKCVDCGYSENADINAARNILAAGHAVLACGEIVQSGYSVKQEPVEVTTQITAWRRRNPLPERRGGCQLETPDKL